MTFLNPTPSRLIIMAVFLVIAYGGHTQSWAFSSKDMTHPPPPLMGLFQSIPYLWESWIVLLAPLSLACRLVGIQQFFDAGPTWFFWMAQALYFYLTASIIVLLWGKLTRRDRSATPNLTRHDLSRKQFVLAAFSTISDEPVIHFFDPGLR